MLVEVCDFSAATPDFWQMVATAYVPVGILGKMVNNRALTGGCTGQFALCRPGTTVGPIKAIVSVIHVDGGPGTSYSLEVVCEDKFFDLINDTKTTLQRKPTNQ